MKTKQLFVKTLGLSWIFFIVGVDMLVVQRGLAFFRGDEDNSGYFRWPGPQKTPAKICYRLWTEITDGLSGKLHQFAVLPLPNGEAYGFLTERRYPHIVQARLLSTGEKIWTINLSHLYKHDTYHFVELIVNPYLNHLYILTKADSSSIFYRRKQPTPDLIAIDATTGQELWKNFTSGSGLGVDKEQLYTFKRTKFFTINPKTGSPISHVTTDEDYSGRSKIVQFESKLYMIHGHSIRCFSPSKMQNPLWTWIVGDHHAGLPVDKEKIDITWTISRPNKMVYFLISNKIEVEFPHLNPLNEFNEELDRKEKERFISILDSKNYPENSRGILVAIDLEKGKVVWETKTSYQIWFKNYLVSDPNRNIYVPANDGTLQKYNGKTGTLLWEKKYPIMDLTVSMGKDFLYAIGLEPKYYKKENPNLTPIILLTIDPKNGEILWSISIERKDESDYLNPPLIYGNKLYLFGDKGYYMISED